MLDQLLSEWLSPDRWVALWNSSEVFRWASCFVIALTVWSWIPSSKLGQLKAVRLKQQEVPPEVQAYFDAQDDPLHRAGFSPAGDYQTVHGKRPNYARFYTCREQDIFIEVNCYRKISGLFGTKDGHCVSCISVFEDGTCWQTGSISLPDNGALAPPQLILRGRPKVSLAELIAVHRTDVTQYAFEHQTSILHYPPDQLPEVSIYYTQYMREHFVKKRWLTPPQGYEQTKAMISANQSESYAEVNV